MTRCALLLAVFCACGPADRGDAELFGAEVVIDASAGNFARAPDFVPRFRRVLEQSATWYGRDQAEYAGLRIVVASGPVCGAPNVSGCYSESTNTITVSEVPGTVLCAEDLTLPHEALHYFLRGAPLHGDPDHTDPLWRTVLDLMQNIGYGTCEP